MNRKEFLSDCGRMGFAGAVLSLFPWLESCSEKAKQEVSGEKARIGIIGTGSRGVFHIKHLLQQRFAEVFFRYKRIFYRSYRHVALASFRVWLFSLCTGINAVSTIYFEQFILPKHIMLHVISAVFALTIVHLYHLSKHYRVYNSKSQ